MILRGKRGSESVLHGELIFIILNLVFFCVLIGFASLRSTDVYLYEQVYAKQIALLIDQSKPGTIITMDVSKAYEVARKNSRLPLSGLFFVDNEKNQVRVQFSNKGTGYVFEYFTDAEIEFKDAVGREQLQVLIKPEDENG